MITIKCDKCKKELIQGEPKFRVYISGGYFSKNLDINVCRDCAIKIRDFSKSY